MLYLYPTTITDDVLDAMAESEKVCKYVDLPLQHASDRVLKRMKRPGTRAAYERLLDRIRQRVPGVTLRTTFIVGFPGETAEDYAELQSFVEAVAVRSRRRLHLLPRGGHVRARPGRRCAGRRSRRRRQTGVMRLQRRIVERAQRARIGSQVRVLVDGPSAEHDLVLRGRLEGQAPDIDPLVYLTDCDPSALTAGQFVQAEVVASRAYDLRRRGRCPGPNPRDKLEGHLGGGRLQGGLVPTFFVSGR